MGSTSVAIGAVGEGYEGGGIAIGALAAAGRGGQAKERMFDIETAGLSPAQSPENFTVSTDTCDDPITCTAVSERYVTVGRRSGTISRYTLPHLTPENVYKFGSEISRMVLELINLSCIKSTYLYYSCFRNSTARPADSDLLILVEIFQFW